MHSTGSVATSDAPGVWILSALISIPAGWGGLLGLTVEEAEGIS